MHGQQPEKDKQNNDVARPGKISADAHANKFLPVWKLARRRRQKHMLLFAFYSGKLFCPK